MFHSVAVLLRHLALVFFRRFPSRTFVSGIVILLFAVFSTIPTSLQAAILSTGFNEAELVRGLVRPTTMTFAPDGRVFVAEQSGNLRVIKDGKLLATPFAQIAVDAFNERGLLGIAVDPDFETTQYIYIKYVSPTPSCHHVISRLTANGDVAVPNSEHIVIDLGPCGTAGNHNGGAIHFGLDGKLYVSLGDNGQSTTSQSMTSVKGKLLRFNRDGSIPTDNPFYTTATGINRAIYALGLRNPFTFAIQPGTGRIFANDVGRQTWEEINDIVAGGNYGWPLCEGNCSPTDPRYVDPTYTYQHNASGLGECAIVGGSFYNPTTRQFPKGYVGDYFFADYCAGWIKRLDLGTGNVWTFIRNTQPVVDLKVGPDGSLYYLTRSGIMYKVSYSNLPAISSQPRSVSTGVDRTVQFSVVASGASPFTYQWQRNGQNIAGATHATYTFTAKAEDNGAKFRCIVQNAYGSVTSKNATVTIVANSKPTGAITLPAKGTLYSGGEVINFAGTGSDPEDGDLPASAFEWRVDFHHESHVHPFLASIPGVKSGSFTIPMDGETAYTVWYRIYLTVTDAGGLKHQSYRDILPRTTTIVLNTTPPGLQVTLEGQPLGTPSSIFTVVGVRRTIGVISPQTVNGITYVFDKWSDNLPATHTIRPPSTGGTYTATYLVQSGSIVNGQD